ncbi:MAG: hypothetical protein HZA53_10080 [Planctomycetes bacterium]|nr:hypothetical protein [Planctomycetota bacterium]
MNVRILAWRILRKQHATPLRLAEAVAERAQLSGRDRRLLLSLVGIELRRRGTLNTLVRHFSRGKADTAVGAHVALGLIQAFLLDRIPDHAVVAESVRAARITLGERHGRTVEIVLRAALGSRMRGNTGDVRRDLPLRDLAFANSVFHDPKEHPLLWAEEALSMPVPIMKRWLKRYGEERAFGLARGALEEPDLSVRVVQGERKAVCAELATIEIAARDGAHDRIFLVPRSRSARLLASVPFTEGRITIQGETALRAAELVQARADERILDLCAAPGGKTAVLAAAGARVVARDVDEKRLARVTNTLARLKLATNVELSPGRGAEGLAPDAFDAVLVDAPCSNTGVLGKRPGARWRFSSDSQVALGALQAALLADAARCVRPGGRLVYSTCSIEPEENQRRVKAFLGARADFALEAELDHLPDTRGPSGPLDGGYAARLRRA